MHQHRMAMSTIPPYGSSRIFIRNGASLFILYSKSNASGQGTICQGVYAASERQLIYSFLYRKTFHFNRGTVIAIFLVRYGRQMEPTESDEFYLATAEANGTTDPFREV